MNTKHFIPAANAAVPDCRKSNTTEWVTAAYNKILNCYVVFQSDSLSVIGKKRQGEIEKGKEDTEKR